MRRLRPREVHGQPGLTHLGTTWLPRLPGFPLSPSLAAALGSVGLEPETSDSPHCNDGESSGGTNSTPSVPSISWGISSPGPIPRYLIPAGHQAPEAPQREHIPHQPSRPLMKALGPNPRKNQGVEIWDREQRQERQPCRLNLKKGFSKYEKTRDNVGEQGVGRRRGSGDV